MRLPAVTTLALCALAACAVRPRPEAIGAAAAAIEDGATDTQDSFAVGVCGGAPGDCSLVCSGVLVAPNLVVTARHCVEASNDTTITCATSQFANALNPAAFFSITTDVSMHQSTLGWHAVSQIWIPDSAQSAVCGDDIALLLLSDVLTADEASPATPNLDTPLTDEAVFAPAETAIGYGLSTGLTDPDTSGTRRIRKGVPFACVPGDADPALACDAITLENTGDNEFVTGDAVCQGDSGSGAFAQEQFDSGDPVVLGVLSRGTLDAQDPSQCLGGTYTRLDRWSAFLRQGAVAAAQAGGYPRVSWGSADAGAPGGGGSVSDASTSSGVPSDAADSAAGAGEEGGAVAADLSGGGCAVAPPGPTSSGGRRRETAGGSLLSVVAALAAALRGRRAARHLS